MEYNMHYGLIKYVDMLDGPGLRVTLFVSGCDNKCKGCHNPESWDPNFGKEFTEETLTEIVKELQNNYYKGFTLCGGDPLYPANRQAVCNIARTIKACFGDSRSIWMYTGYALEEVQSWNDPVVNELFDYVDVVLEGPFIESLKSPDKPWVGSSNQRMFEILHCKGNNTFKFVENENITKSGYLNNNAQTNTCSCCS